MKLKQLFSVRVATVVFAIAALLSLTMVTAVFAYSSPGKRTGAVNDFGGMLTTSERSELEARLTQFQRSTGNAVVIATVPSLGGDSVENFAEKLFQEWGIGNKEKDNGLLILIARDDHKIRLEVGYGLEPVITDAVSSNIIRNIISPAFKSGKYFEGLNGAVDAVIGTISKDPEYNSLGESQSNGFFSNINSHDWGQIIWFAIFGIIWLCSIMARSKSWWFGGVAGGIIGIIIGFIFGFLFVGIIAIVILIPLGLLFDFIVSRTYANRVSTGRRPPWWIGGGGFGGGSSGSSGGFGGFGGGSSGGGGASGGW